MLSNTNLISHQNETRLNQIYCLQFNKVHGFLDLYKNGINILKYN